MATLLSALPLLLAANRAEAAYPLRTATSHRLGETQGAIKVNGDLSEWNLGIAHSALSIVAGPARIEEGTVENLSDLSAEVSFRHDAEALYIAALVTDDDVVDDPHGGEMYRSDMLDLLLFGATPLHVGFSPHGDFHTFQGKLADGCVQSASARTVGGYTIEAKLLRRCLRDIPGGGPVSINLAVRDKDSRETQPAHVCWSGYRHNLPGSAGTLLLEPLAKRQAVKLSPTFAEAQRLTAPLKRDGALLKNGNSEVVLRGVNFVGGDQNWARLWEHYDTAEIQKALALAASAGANVVRVFLYFESFGASAPKPEMLARLDDFIGLCKKNGLVSIVSFFADKKDFRRERYAEMAAQLAKVVARYQGDPAIAMWDLMNEPDHAYGLADKGATRQAVAAWIEAMHEVVRAADPTHLITVGYAGHDLVSFLNTTAESESSATEARRMYALSDVVSWHGYIAGVKLSELSKAAASLNKPTVLQEFGLSQLVYTEQAAAEAYQTMCDLAARERWPGVLAWELLDHNVGTLPHVPGYAETDENHFGLFTARGIPKAAAGVFARCGRPATRFRFVN